jgi:hypothetical protein
MKLNQKIAKQIDLDILRTFRLHSLYQDRYGVGQIKLFNILKAYANYNLDLGYTQGMNTIAALLLMYLDEESSFWCLVHIMGHHKYLMGDIFLEGLKLLKYIGFPLLMENCFIHEKLFELKLSKLYSHFQDQGLITTMYSTRWYML